MHSSDQLQGDAGEDERALNTGPACWEEFDEPPLNKGKDLPAVEEVGWWGFAELAFKPWRGNISRGIRRPANLHPGCNLVPVRGLDRQLLGGHGEITRLAWPMIIWKERRDSGGCDGVSFAERGRGGSVVRKCSMSCTPTQQNQPTTISDAKQTSANARFDDGRLVCSIRLQPSA